MASCFQGRAGKLVASRRHISLDVVRDVEARIDALINAAPQKSQEAFALAALPLLFDASEYLSRLEEQLEAAEKALETPRQYDVLLSDMKEQLEALQAALHEIADGDEMASAEWCAEVARAALASPEPVDEGCEHEWVDASNDAVESGWLCIKCHRMAAEKPDAGCDTNPITPEEWQGRGTRCR